MWCRRPTVVVSQCRWRKYRFTIYSKAWCRSAECRSVAGENKDLQYIIRCGVVVSQCRWRKYRFTIYIVRHGVVLS